MAEETLHDSLRLAATNTSIDKGTIVSEASTTVIPRIINCYLLVCNNFNDALAFYFSVSNVVCCFIHNHIGSCPNCYFFVNGPQVKSTWPTLL